MSYRFCPACATPLAEISQAEDGGDKVRLRCPACSWTHWNNPVPVLAAIVECVDQGGRVLLARNAAWTHRMFALITGFMEAGESPEDGIRREVAEETALQALDTTLVGVHEFLRMNQVIITFHVRARGEVRLSPELAEYKLFAPEDIRCWRAGTGLALAQWLRSRGHEPQFIELPLRA
ncbi:MAG: NUDIX domain-containing protein [Burkholderiaceae bacterium]|nr:NUDIX domain-containing protein [Rhodoferax sp.]MCP5284153.1 NUDIX domain-containing protein [Burkholderiaceae bacterium]